VFATRPTRPRPGPFGHSSPESFMTANYVRNSLGNPDIASRVTSRENPGSFLTSVEGIVSSTRLWTLQPHGFTPSPRAGRRGCTPRGSCFFLVYFRHLQRLQRKAAVHARRWPGAVARSPRFAVRA